jgi:alpha-D-xyloside xylohydrolase
VDDAYMMGDSLLVAPLFTGEKERNVYLPKGRWFDFYTHQCLEGGRVYKVAADLENIPLFVKDGSLLPLAQPLPFVGADTVFDLNILAFGESSRDFTLYEDDGVTFDFEKGLQNRVTLSWQPFNPPRITRDSQLAPQRYNVLQWQRIPAKTNLVRRPILVKP